MINERTELVKDLVEFTGEPIEVIIPRILNGVYLMRYEWKTVNPTTVEEQKKFYKQTKNYLYDLTQWHFGNRREFDEELIKYLVELKKEKNQILKVLDFGCGIGQNSYMIVNAGVGEVTLADLDSYTLSFAEHRFKKRSLPYKVWKTDVMSAPQEKFDVILAFDVFEHLSEEEYVDVVKTLMRLKAEDCKVFVQASYGSQNDSHPMHYEDSDIRKELLKKLLE